MKLLIAGCAVVTLLAAAVAPSSGSDHAFAAWDAGPGTIDVSSYPEAQQLNYALYAAKCSTCHPLARSINSNLSATKWKRYMKRATRRAGAGLGDDEATRISAFLEYHSARKRGAPAPLPATPAAAQDYPEYSAWVEQ